MLWFLAEKDQNVPYKKSRDALEAARKKHNADITLITIPGAAHSFLIKGADGTVHYTDRYWPEMARWLRARGVSHRAFRNCGLLAKHDSPRAARKLTNITGNITGTTLRIATCVVSTACS